MSVNDLLRDSMIAHRQAQVFLRAKNRDAAKEQWTKARDLRVEAARSDPERKDPAWEAEQKETPFGRDSNDELLRFYNSLLGP